MPRNYDARHRSYCFTAYPEIEYPKDSGKFIQIFDWDSADSYVNLEDKVKYLTVGKEICPKTKREHHQGYVIWNSAKTMSATRKLLPRGTHVEPQKSPSDFRAAEYCWEDEDVIVEFGERPDPGKRNDLHGVRKMVADGLGMRDIVQVCESYQAIKGGEVLLKYMEKTRDWLPEVFWYWGPAGSGKTRVALDRAGPDPWISGRNLKWWYDYDGHEDVIIDDFRGDFCTFHELLRILDRYPYVLETKGGHRQLLARRIWITSCFPPEKVYQTREDIAQLLRRITRVMEFKMNPAHEVARLPERWEFIDGQEVLVSDPNPPMKAQHVRFEVDEAKVAAVDSNRDRLERLQSKIGAILCPVKSAQKLLHTAQGSGVILAPTLPVDRTLPSAEIENEDFEVLLDELLEGL